MSYFIGALLSLFMLNTISLAQDTPIIIDADNIIAEIQPEMWGIFFEDINFGADGGLYAELIKNRSFEFNDPFTGWKEIKESGASGEILILNHQLESTSDSRYMRIKFNSGNGRFGIENEGFRGIGVHNNTELIFSLLSRVCDSTEVTIHIELTDSSGEIIGRAELPQLTGDWTNNSVRFYSQRTDPKCSLRVMLTGEGTIDLDMISLFPVNTWKGRQNGLREDLVHMLADLKPGFLRFPGGCIVEGRDLKTRYQWKNTIGQLNQRKQIINRWNTEFRHRPTPDYYQSFGLGFYEYFLLAEDFGAEPLPVINCGMACQFNTAEVAEDEHISEYIQDALDLIEFANGEADTKWGSIRAAMGHPLPFNMKYLGIGNEQWGEQYINIYKLFAKVLNKKHPEIKLIVSASAYSEGEEFEYLWKQHRALNSDIVDEHYYKKPEWFFENADRYDNYDREGPKVFAGEYAAQSVAVCSPENKNTWICALSEAAFMTGLERNAEIVTMASYAPLLSHLEAWQWTPDLIYFNNLRCFGSASYYVQKMFSNNRGSHVISITQDHKALTGQNNIYASACIDQVRKELIIKVVNSSSQQIKRSLIVNNAVIADDQADIIQLFHADPEAYNSLEEPEKIVPVESRIKVQNGIINCTLEGYSISVFRTKII